MRDELTGVDGRPVAGAPKAPSVSVLVTLAATARPGYLAVAFVLPSMPSWIGWVQQSAALDRRLALWTNARALAPAEEGGLTASLSFWAVMLALVSYVLALRRARRCGDDPRAGVIAAGVAVAFGITSVLALPSLDTDVYLYTLYARVLTVHGANPYVTVPATFQDDPFVPLVYVPWASVASLYGPVWMAVSALVECVAGDDPVRALFAFRLALFGCGLAALAVIWRIAGRLNPTHRVASLVAWGWNPIVVVYGPQKLDTLVTLLVLLGIWAWTERRHMLGMAALAVATLTKLTAAPLLVVCLLARGWHSGHRSPLVGLGICVGVATVAALPSSMYTRLLILFLPGFLGAVVLAARLSATPARLMNGMAMVALYSAAFLTPLNKPWYLLMLIGLLGVTASGRVIAAGVAVCATALVVTLLPLLVAVDATVSTLVSRLSTVVCLAVLAWACTPLLLWARAAGIRPWAERSRGRSKPASESPT